MIGRVGHARAANRSDHVRILRLEHRGEARRETFDEPLVDLIGLVDAVVRARVRVVVDLHVERPLRRGAAGERHSGEGPARADDLFGCGRHLEAAAHVPQQVAVHEDAVGRSDRADVDPAVSVPVAEEHGRRARARGARGQRGPAPEAVRRLERAAGVEDLHLRASVRVAVHGDEVVPPVTGHVARVDRGAAQVVLALVRRVHVVHEGEAVGVRIEDEHARLRVRRLIERRDLLRSSVRVKRPTAKRARERSNFAGPESYAPWVPPKLKADPVDSK